MKRLTLLRHAKSGTEDSLMRDFDRPLNAKGKRAARAAGEQMRRENLHFERVAASPAVRVAETLAEVEHGLRQTLAPQWERRMYLASAVTLLDVIQETPDDVSSLLLVGHNPGLEDLVLMLVPDGVDDAVRDQVEEKYPTASRAEIACDVERWSDIKAGKATLLRFVRPRDLDSALGPDIEA